MTRQEFDDPIAQRGRVVAKAREQLEAAASRDDTDRSLIARVVVLGFGISVLLVVLLLFAGAALSGDWQDAMAGAVDLVKSVLLPVVTLILGYYFGRAVKG